MQSLLTTSLHDLELDIHIGTSEKEREHKQKIKITFSLYQTVIPDCCTDPDSESYLCYSTLAHSIKDYCHGKHFRLLEYLCFQIHNLIKGSIPYKAEVHVVVQKMYPNDVGIKYVAQCEYGDSYGKSGASPRF